MSRHLRSVKYAPPPRMSDAQFAATERELVRLTLAGGERKELLNWKAHPGSHALDGLTRATKQWIDASIDTKRFGMNARRKV